MKKLIFLFFLLVQVYNLNQIFYSSAHAEERSVIIKEKRGASPALPSNMKYHALIIGSNNYKFLPKLQTAIADAKAIEDILRNKYGFKTRLLIDATRDDILNNINEIRKKLVGNENLLIYYAGHGEYDKNVDKAYWLPVDAERDNPTKWIIADDITSNIKRISSKHILLVSDSCYSGTLTRAAIVDLKGAEKEEYIKKMFERPSRTLMASGGNEPVADSGGGDHSVFASAFLKALREADKGMFTAEELFHGRVKEIVAGKSDQVPEYNTIKNSGHEGGDFVFQLASIADAGLGLKPEPAIPPSSEISEELIKLREEKAKLEREREELAQKKAIMEEKKHLEEEREKLEKEKTELAMAKQPPSSPFSKGEFKDPITGMEFILVKGGCFQMGDTFGDGYSSEKPVHEVCVDDIYIGKYEVTQGQWKAIMGNNPSSFKYCGDNCPVENVSWNDAQEYINKLNNKTGKKYRLPTEAEWEYAARSGGKNEKYAGGNDIDSVAWYDSNSGDKTHPVGQKQPNGLGVYDMSGNIWEWVQDWYDDNYYKNSPKDNPKGANSGQYRALRGGSWSFKPRFTRSANRVGLEPAGRVYNSGFRLVLPAQ